MSARTAHDYRVSATHTLKGASPETVDLLVFETHTGFEQDSDGQKIWPGGGASQEPLSAPATIGDGEISRTYRPERDDAFLERLRAGVGKADMTIIIQPLDADGVASGKRRVINGKQKGLKEPESEGGSGEPARLSIPVLAGGTVGS